MIHLGSDSVYSVDAHHQLHAPDDLSDFIKKYKKLIQKIAGDIKKICPSHIELNDLLQTGIVGLLEARNTYSSCKGAQFVTYASFKIKYALYEYLRTASGISRELSQNIKKINNTIAILENGQAEISSRNIAQGLRITLEKYHGIMNNIHNFKGMSNTENDMEAFSNAEENPMEQVLLNNLLSNLKNMITTLPERQQLILSLYYHQHLNFKQIGEVLNLTEARVSQLHKLSLLFLKKQL